MNRYIQVILGMVKNNLVQLSSVTVKDWSIGILIRRILRNDMFARVFVDSKSVFFEVDADGLHLLGDFAIHAPTSKYAAGVGAERDDISKWFQNRESFVDFNIMALSVTFNGSSKSAKTCFR